MGRTVDALHRARSLGAVHTAEHAARLQRERRQRMTRIDYMPAAVPLALICERQSQERPGSVAATNRAVIDAIVIEWARLTGRLSVEPNEAKAPRPELRRTSRACAGASDSALAMAASPELSDDYARAYEFAGTSPAKPLRASCGAKRHRDGQPCQSRPEPGKRRCRFHGGRSTGPRTAEGKARALANLRRGRVPAAT